MAIRAGAPQEVAIGTNFGLLLPSQGGSPWSWACEEAIGYSSGQRATPLYAANGWFWVASSGGLFVSKDGGCSWSSIPEFDDDGALDLIEVPGQPGTLLVAAGNSLVANRLFKSTDHGTSFQPTGLTKEQVVFSAVRAAPSNSQRVYVSGWMLDNGASEYLFRSDDGGNGFIETNLTGKLPHPGIFVLEAVSPTNPDVLFAAVDGTDTPPRAYLLRSLDGGQTFEEVLSAYEMFTSVTVSDDGSTVWAATTAWLYRSNDGGKTFTQLTAPQKSGCVERSGDVLYACGWPAIDGWALGQSSNEGDTFTSALEWKDIAGPLECAEGTTVRTRCPPLWPALQQAFGLAPPSTPDAGTAVDGGDTAEAPPPRGCGCGAVSLPFPAAVLIAALLSRRRR